MKHVPATAEYPGSGHSYQPRDAVHVRTAGAAARFTDNTVTDAAALARVLEEAARSGHAFDNEEAEKGVCCVGAGIRSDEGVLVAGLSVSAPTERFDRKWAGLVQDTADRVSRALGWQAPRPAA